MLLIKVIKVCAHTFNKNFSTFFIPLSFDNVTPTNLNHNIFKFTLSLSVSLSLAACQCSFHFITTICELCSSSQWTVYQDHIVATEGEFVSNRLSY